MVNKKRILTVGVFDLLHLGHIRLFKRARERGDYLIVAVQLSDYAKKYKPNAEIIYSTEQRVEMVESIKFVDQVLTYDTVDTLARGLDYNVLVVGPDQNNDKFQKAIEYSKENGKEVIMLERTKDISSSELKSKIDKIFW